MTCASRESAPPSDDFSKETCWGEPAALSETFRFPWRVPLAEGVKLTEMEHWAPGAKVRGQVLVSLKSPVVAKLLIVNAAVPVLLSVTGWAEPVVLRVWLVKVSVEGLSEVAGAGDTPVPLSRTEWGERPFKNVEIWCPFGSAA